MHMLIAEGICFILLCSIDGTEPAVNQTRVTSRINFFDQVNRNLRTDLMRRTLMRTLMRRTMVRRTMDAIADSRTFIQSD